MLLLRLAWGFPGGSVVRNLPAMHERWTGDAGLIPGSFSPGEGNCKTLVFLPAKAQSMESQKSQIQLGN